MVGKYFGAGYWRSKYGMQIFTRQISRKRRLQRATISICMALGFQNITVNYYVTCTNSQCLIIVSQIFNVEDNFVWLFYKYTEMQFFSSKQKLVYKSRT